MKKLSGLKYNNSTAVISGGEIYSSDYSSTIDDLIKKWTEPIVNYTFEDSTTNSISFDVDIKVDEVYDVYILGSTTGNSDIKLTFDDISMTSFQCGWYNNASNTSSGGDLGSLITNYRPQYSYFYYAQSMRNNPSSIHGILGFLNNGEGVYVPTYLWQSKAVASGTQMISNCGGYVACGFEGISKLTFSTVSTGVYFNKNTRIIIKRRF